MGNRRKPDVARPEAWEALRRFEDDEVEVLGGRRLLAELYGLYQAVGQSERGKRVGCGGRV
jgi:hypothetical protein